MTYENVSIVVMADTVPVSDVVVRLIDSNGLVVGQPSTDVNGTVSFLLPAPATYQCRFFKQGYTFQQPQYINVAEATLNVFETQCVPFVPPVSIDPRLCTVYGYFKTPAGQPAKNVDIQFITLFSPILVDGNPVLRERVTTTTDKNGYVCLTLYRCGTYDVLVEGFEDNIRTISVPDAANANIGYLLFPTIKEISFSPAGPYAVTAGNDLILTPTITLTSGAVLNGSGIDDLFWTSSDPEVLALGLTPTTLVLKGKVAGSATVTAAPMNTTIRQLPEATITGVPFAVSVL